MGFITSLLGNSLSSLAGNFSGAVGQGLANRVFGESLEDKQRYALEQMEKQAQLNRENYDYQFNKQLQATDPSFIRQRLERAGLAPSLAFSNGASSPGISAQMGSSSTAGGISSSLRSGQMVNMAESLARIRNLDADTEGKKTETDYNQKAMQTRLDILSQEKLSKMYANNIARIDALYKEDITQATLDKLTKEIDAITFDMANRKELTDIERQKLNAYLESLTHQYSLWKSQIDLNKAKEETEVTQQGLNISTANLQDSKRVQQDFDNAFYRATYMRPGENAIEYAVKLSAFKMAYDTLTKDEKRVLMDMGILVSDQELSAEERRKAFFLEKVSADEWKKILKDVAENNK